MSFSFCDVCKKETEIKTSSKRCSGCLEKGLQRISCLTCGTEFISERLVRYCDQCRNMAYRSSGKIEKECNVCMEKFLAAPSLAEGKRRCDKCIVEKKKIIGCRRCRTEILSIEGEKFCINCKKIICDCSGKLTGLEIFVDCKECLRKVRSKITEKHLLESGHISKSTEEYERNWGCGSLYSERLKRKIGLFSLGRKFSAEVRAANSKRMLENNPAKREEVRKKISEKLKGRNAWWMLGELNPAKREEVRKKISESSATRIFSEDHMKKITFGAKRRWLTITEEEIRDIREGWRRWAETEEGKGIIKETLMRGMRTQKEKRPSKIQVKLAEYFIPLGFEQELEVERPGFPCWIDIAHKEKKIAIFVDGCWYHGCERCMSKEIIESEDKKRQRRADKASTSFLLNRGWQVFRIWEHSLEESFDLVLNLLLKKIGASDKEVLSTMLSYYKERGFPYPGISRRKILDEKRLIQDFVVGETLPTVKPNKIFYAFMDHVWTMHKRGKKSAVEYFTEDLPELILNRLKYAKAVTDATMRNGLKIGQGVPSNFNPLWAKFLAVRYKAKEVFDPCAGFGGRMLGSVLAGANYTACEIVKETFTRLKEMAEVLDLSKVTLFHKDVRQYNIEYGKYDLVIVGPPWADLEIYDEKIAQIEKEFWEKDLMLPLLDVCIQGMRGGGKLALHLPLGWQVNFSPDLVKVEEFIVKKRNFINGMDRDEVITVYQLSRV